MRMIDPILGELAHESQATARMLERVPQDRLAWTPHPKSTPLGKLAWHIASIPSRVSMLLREGAFDLGAARPSEPPDQVPEIVTAFHTHTAEVRALLEALDDEAARKPFTFKRGEQVLREVPTIVMVRNILLNHTYHHRGQLSVYLRLLDVPVPATYGTSADENPFA
jgi:uncharacterized damage-inducible protein DinB